MVKSNKIKELINCILKCSGESYIDSIKKLGLTRSDFEGQIHFSTKKYTRTCIAQDANFELILLGWSEGQKTPIHNHDGHEGFVYALEGKLAEVTYAFNAQTQQLEKTYEATLIENELSYAEKDVNGFHSIENVNDGTSLSLHLYKKPIKSCLVFDEKNQKMVTKELVFDFE